MGLNESNNRKHWQNIRQPAVAGVFYPDDEEDLQRLVSELVDVVPRRHPLLVCLAPHAGYVYSGAVAGRVYGHLDVPRKVLVLGPNHTGYGAPVSVASQAAWSTPLGEVSVDQDLAEEVLEAFPAAERESQAHWREHSIEVQLPFLKARQESVSVLPICLKHLALDECLALGRAIGRVAAAQAEPVGVVVSTDMSHSETEAVARELDGVAIDAVLSLDPENLYRTVHERRISMCGVIPATVALAAAADLGPIEGHRVAYATSADVSGDKSSVVGYAGVCVHRA
jgi:AmmeMemoRadiSam system protein B